MDLVQTFGRTIRATGAKEQGVSVAWDVIDNVLKQVSIASVCSTSETHISIDRICVPAELPQN